MYSNGFQTDQQLLSYDKRNIFVIGFLLHPWNSAQWPGKTSEETQGSKESLV